MRAEGGGEIGLAGAGGTDAEDKRVGAHQIEIGGLGRRTRAHDARRSRPDRRHAEISTAADLGCSCAANRDLGIDLRQFQHLLRLRCGHRARAGRPRRCSRASGAPSTATRLPRIATRTPSLLFDAHEILGMRAAQRRQQRVVRKFERDLLPGGTLRAFRSGTFLTGRRWRAQCAASYSAVRAAVPANSPFSELGNTSAMRTERISPISADCAVDMHGLQIGAAADGLSRLAAGLFKQHVHHTPLAGGVERVLLRGKQVPAIPRDGRP